MSMFMAAMRQAARDGELEDMGMLSAALKQDVAKYETGLVEEERSRAALTAALTTSTKGED